MDKYEYRQRAEEIKSLIENKEYAEAMMIADTIDWTRVKSVMMLTTVSDLYKINKRYDISRDILLLAYERYPGGRSIVYSLCELSIKMNDFVQAVEYYKEFIRIAPKDTGRYILQYKLYEAQGVNTEELIEVLEEFKSQERREKWCYELAFLYHKIGLTSKCVEECDEIVLWFGSGKYVTKALELKMIHEPLTPAQQDKYMNRNRVAQPVSIENADESIHVKTFDAGSQFNTIDIQKEIAKNMQDLMAEETQVSFEEAGKPERRALVEPSYDTIEQAVISEFMLDNPSEVKAEGNMQEIIFANDETESTEFVTEQPMTDEPVEEITTDELVTNEPTEDEEEKPMRTTSIVTNSDESVLREEVPIEYADKLSQEYDGQISFVVPGNDMVEQQITGQLNFDDILAEWERIKQDLKSRSEAEIKQRVEKQTSEMLLEFDVIKRHSSLDELEAVADAQIAKNIGMQTASSYEDDNSEDEEEDVYFGDEEVLRDVSQEVIDNFGNYDTGNSQANEITTIAEAVQESDAKEADGIEEALEEPEADTEEIDEPEETSQEPESDAEEMAEVEETEVSDEQEELSQEPETETGEPAEDEDSEEPEISEEISYVEAELEVDEVTYNVEEADTPQEDNDNDNAKPQPSMYKAAEDLTDDEKELFEETVGSASTTKQVEAALEKISLASYTGNVLITGENTADTVGIAKTLIKNVQQTDANFSGRVAKISGQALNKKDISQTLEKLMNGAIIVERCKDLERDTVKQILRYINREGTGIIVILEDTKRAMQEFLGKNKGLVENFNVRIDIARLDDRALARYGKKYAYEKEYAIDEMGMLALQTRISNMQTAKHSVTLAEVREIVDEAIRSANRKNIKHFFNVVFSKRYDAEDMIILKEKDFIC